MFEPLVKLLEAGLEEDSEKVMAAAKEYIKTHYTKVKGIGMPYEYRLAKRFKKVLDGRQDDK